MAFKKFGVILLISFLLFSILVSLGVFNTADELITITIQKLLPSSLDTPLSVLSLLGSFEMTTILLIIVMYSLKLKRSITAIFMFGLGMGIELLGKTFIYHPDPPKIFLRYHLGIFLPSGLVQTGFSYPSGHSFRTAFLILIISYLISQAVKIKAENKKIYSFLAFLFLFLMLASRVSLGEHWTTDVIGGTLLGFGLAGLTIPFLEKR